MTNSTNGSPSHPMAITINAGSSSLKFGLYSVADPIAELATGLVENIGGSPRLKAKSGRR